MANGTLDANESSAEFILPPRGVIGFTGTWDGATITPEVHDGVSTFQSLSTTFTEDAEKVFNFDRPVTMKLTMSSAGGSSDVDWYVL